MEKIKAKKKTMPNVDKPQITHFQGDGCPDEHGKQPNQKEQEWEKAFGKANIRHLVLNEDTELNGIVWVSKEDVIPFISAQISKAREEEYKKGYNDCLREQKLTGEKYQNLYL